VDWQHTFWPVHSIYMYTKSMQHHLHATSRGLKYTPLPTSSRRHTHQNVQELA